MFSPSPASSLDRYEAMSLASFNAARASHGLTPVAEIPRTHGTANTYKCHSEHVSGVIQADSSSQAEALFRERNRVVGRISVRMVA